MVIVAIVYLVTAVAIDIWILRLTPVFVTLTITMTGFRSVKLVIILV